MRLQLGRNKKVLYNKYRLCATDFDKINLYSMLISIYLQSTRMHFKQNTCNRKSGHAFL